MNTEEFYQSRKQEWQRLADLVGRGNRDVRALALSDIEQLASLYRAVSSDLALAKRDFPQHPVTRYLNQLVARAHATLYQGEPFAVNRLLDFAVRGFPRLFRETFVFTLAAFLMFTIPALAAGASIAASPRSAQWFLPADVQQLIPELENKNLWVNIPIQERPFASSFIMQNNIRVSFLAFSSGLTAGLLTLWVLVQNGLILGGLLGLAAHYGVGSDLATFVIGHGVIELSVIFMAGGSGLMLAWAILHPGLMRRRDALALVAQKSVRLLGGAVPWLVIAALIEGFISPSESLPWQVKWGVGISSGIVLYAYLFLAGRDVQRGH
ncbi:MAG TPA: stage II sporulation protein M [Anaerolineales bacterium]